MAKKKIKIKKPKGTIDYPFLIITLLLLGIGLLMVFSSSYPSAYYDNLPSTYYFLRQAFFAVVGVVVMLAIAYWFNYKLIRPLSPIFLAVTVLLLILVLAIGTGLYGEKRWINLGFATFQPSELAKAAVIFFFASLISIYSDKMKTFKYGVLPFIAVLGIIAVLMVLEPHLSGTIIILGIGAVMMFVGGTHWGWFAGAIGAAGLGGAFVISRLGYAQGRLSVWLDPFVDPQGLGYQSIQSLYAIGSGGLFGLGFGNSRQKYLYLPEAHNDFIYAIICEELGFIGAMIVMLLFVMLIIRGYWIAIHAPDKFGSLLVVGITTQVALQVFINIGVVTGVLPVTGAALPFFSYGGTSLLVLLAEMGVVLAVSRKIPAPKAG